jgi:hypothetical protein
MKKLTVVLMVLLALVCFTSSTFAGNKPSEDPATATTEMGSSAGTIMGKIVSIDKAKNSVVVKDDETNTDKAIMVEAKDIKKLKKGKLVKIVLAPGSTDKAGSIEVVKAEPGKAERGKQ